jgi:SpoVK/Ycf46/Vps4 family AAA+-type ATPase
MDDLDDGFHPNDTTIAFDGAYEPCGGDEPTDDEPADDEIPGLDGPDVPPRPYASHLEHLEDWGRRAATLVAAHAARTPARRRYGGDSAEITPEQLVGAAGDASVRELELRRRADAVLARIRAREAVTTIELPLARLAERFGLSPIEVDGLVLCAVPRIDPRRAASWGALDIDLDPPTVGTVIAVLATSLEASVRMRRTFSRDGRLLGGSVLLVDGRRGDDDLLEQRLRVPRRIMSELLGSAELDDELVPFSAVVKPTIALDQVVLPPETKALVASLVDGHERLAATRRAWGLDEVIAYGRGHVLLFAGPPGTGKTMLAHAVANAVGKRLFVVDAARLVETATHVDEAIDVVFREARLLDAVLFFDECEQLFASRKLGNAAMPALLTRIEQVEGVAILATNLEGALDEALSRRILARIDFRPPGPSARAEIWRRHLPAALPRASDVDCDALAERFELTGGTIKNAVLAAVSQVVANGRAEVGMAELEAAARLQLRFDGELDESLVTPTITFDDVVVADEARARLERFVRAGRARSTALTEWGLARTLGRGTGIAALLHGPPGTGKSMTAEAIAHALGRPLLRCSIASVLSKWVGDTSRKLGEAFALARQHRAVLVFDEADALFARRVRVRSAQDRFVNAETGALLDQLERHDGVTILTSNLASELDEAFERRLQLRLELPRPDARARAALYRRMLTGEAPLTGDVDLGALARAYDLSGAQIRNAVLTAALEAASAPPGERRITHAMLESAARDQAGPTAAMTAWPPASGLAS